VVALVKLAFDRFVQCALGSQVVNLDKLKAVLAIVSLEELEQPGKFSGVSDGAANLVAVFKELLSNMRAH
jgi:hypothetical protein